MSDTDDFRAILSRAASGDRAAATSLVGQVEPRIRAAVRGQIDDLKLRRVLDSGDISQSVLARFFQLAAGDTFDLPDPDRLVALLVTMARNQVRDEARREYSDRRGGGGTAISDDHLLAGLTCPEPTPSRAISDREIVAEFLGRLPTDARYLAEQRAAGREWADLAAELGSSAQALRKRLGRAVGQVAADLGIVRGALA